MIVLFRFGHLNAALDVACYSIEVMPRVAMGLFSNFRIKMKKIGLLAKLRSAETGLLEKNNKRNYVLKC